MHTKTPFTIRETGPAKRFVVESNGEPIVITYGGENQEEDARFIVRACNNHDELVSALEWYVRHDYDDFCMDGQMKARAVLAKIKEG